MTGCVGDAETRTALQDYMHNLDRLTVYVDNKGGREQVCIYYLHLRPSCCVAGMCCKSARHRLTAAHSNATQITDGCGVGQL